ncbi:hypothetical protein RFI_08924 [Reticulomyxa filosa]|uniref:Uncharacterized protein n=1 Tax=Reticulomyxa filosa TaxID=46433 RepID=X6NS89_RETFI|nr:hypothetical protein RFI_08924 [Reticulomyxa filosa]|eukprot:ETO28207.1 hypothetical protein RFI_08924 [Reticulomyxa filosa]
MYVHMYARAHKFVVNVFKMKDTVKLKFIKNAKFWGIRPMTKEMIIYAGLDSFLTLQVGRSYIQKFSGNEQYHRTLYVSNTFWSQSTRKEHKCSHGSGRVPHGVIREMKRDLSNQNLLTIFSSTAQTNVVDTTAQHDNVIATVQADQPTNVPSDQNTSVEQPSA